MEDDLVRRHEQRADVFDAAPFASHRSRRVERSLGGRLHILARKSGRVALDQVRLRLHAPDATEAALSLHQAFAYVCTRSAMRAPSSARDLIPSFL